MPRSMLKWRVDGTVTVDQGDSKTSGAVYIYIVYTVCPNIYRKSVLHLLKYRFAVNVGTHSIYDIYIYTVSLGLLSP